MKDSSTGIELAVRTLDYIRFSINDWKADKILLTVSRKVVHGNLKSSARIASCILAQFTSIEFILP